MRIITRFDLDKVNLVEKITDNILAQKPKNALNFLVTFKEY